MKDCSATVFQTYGHLSYPCSRKGTVERNGQWYCTQHDPVKIQERQDAAQIRYDERTEQEAKERVSRAVRLLTENGYTVIPPEKQ